MYAPAFRSVRALSVAGLCLVAAACGDSNGPSNTNLSTSQAEAVGQSLASSVALMAAQFSGSDPSSILLSGPAPTAVAGIPGLNMSAGVPMPAISNACATVSSTTDTDADGIPDDATITFLAANCADTTVSGDITTLSGTIHVVDPGAFGFTATYTSFKLQYISASGPSNNLTITLSGSQSVGGTTSAATFGHNITLAIKAGTNTGSYSEVWSATFTPTTGSLASGQPLPAGTLTLNGSIALSGGGQSFSFVVTTPTPLAYDPTCVTDSKFTAGNLRAALSGTGGSKRVSVTFGPNCGDVSVVAVGTTA